mgnify:CR=1 FL=1|tara:strand:- start:2126 stop:2392 length:267 start_codon:yes stop_codon:yes gene_type:complete
MTFGTTFKFVGDNSGVEIIVWQSTAADAIRNQNTDFIRNFLETSDINYDEESGEYDFDKLVIVKIGAIESKIDKEVGSYSINALEDFN